MPSIDILHLCRYHCNFPVALSWDFVGLVEAAPVLLFVVLILISKKKKHLNFHEVSPEFSRNPSPKETSYHPKNFTVKVSWQRLAVFVVGHLRHVVQGHLRHPKLGGSVATHRCIQVLATCDHDAQVGAMMGNPLWSHSSRAPFRSIQRGCLCLLMHFVVK